MSEVRDLGKTWGLERYGKELKFIILLGKYSPHGKTENRAIGFLYLRVGLLYEGINVLVLEELD